MATLHLHTSKHSTVVAEARESDKYSGVAFIKFSRFDGDNAGSSELFLSPSQLDQLGRFMINQAEEIRCKQDARHSESSL